MPKKPALSRHPSIPVNPALVWDYVIPAEQDQTDSFRRWYLARVLSRGSSEDLKAMGLEVVYRYFPELNLAPKLRRFWEWYFNLPEVKERYERAHPFSTENYSGDR